MHAQPDYLPIRLLGASGLSRLQQRLEAATRRWLDTWTQKDTVSCSIRVAADDKPLPRVLDPLAECYQISASGAVMLGLRLFPRGLCTVVGLPPDGLSAGPRLDGLAAQLCNSLLRGFVNELMDSASVAAWQFDERTARAQAGRAKRSLSQRALVAIGERNLAELELSPQLVNALVPAAGSQGRGRVESRRSAIGKAHVTLDALIGSVELSLSDFLSLDCGDVVVLGTRLGSGCRVEVPAVASVAEAVVGKRGGRRAIQIRRTETAGRHD